MELPRLKGLYSKLKDRGLEILVIDAARDTDGALQFIKENDLPYRFFETGEGDEEVVRGTFGVGSFPTTFLIGKDGKIKYAYVGFNEGDEAKYEEKILKLLEE